MGLGWIKNYILTMGDNFGVVTPNICRGSLPDYHRLKELKSRGVNTVLTLMNDEKKIEKVGQDAGVLGLTQYVVFMSDRTAPTREQVIGALDVLRNSPPHYTYVQCRGGRHRTGLVIAAYRCVVQGWTKEAAWKEAEKKYGFYSEQGHGPLRDFFFNDFKPTDFQ